MKHTNHYLTEVLEYQKILYLNLINRNEFSVLYSDKSSIKKELLYNTSTNLQKSTNPYDQLFFREHNQSINFVIFQ